MPYLKESWSVHFEKNTWRLLSGCFHNSPKSVLYFFGKNILWEKCLKMRKRLSAKRKELWLNSSFFVENYDWLIWCYRTWNDTKIVECYLETASPTVKHWRGILSANMKFCISWPSWKVSLRWKKQQRPLGRWGKNNGCCFIEKNCFFFQSQWISVRFGQFCS